ncbi:hypothetical protein [Chishuiella sp.]|uniref:hypothetical protein n=1 Tax=Chishuiella sp. TaxID=1969467 RepID=UPI0028B0C042|nr:hypothetical protein [Chishuiella sp.]
MTQEQEKQLLESIYDRLFDVITYQPTSGKNPFKSEETFVHFSKNGAIFPEEYINPRTPSNPLGDLKSSEAFSRLVDQVSPMSLEWETKSQSLSEEYTKIVLGANADTTPDEKMQKIYDKAYDYLHPNKTTINPFTEEEVTGRVDGPDLVAYQDNMDNYVDAIVAYRSSYNIYLDELTSDDEKTKKNADRNWQAKAVKLERDIKSTYNKLIAGNGKYVEQALQILETTVNDGIRRALSIAQENVLEDKKFSSSMGFDNKWLFSYPSPGNWAENNNTSFTELKISGGNEKKKSSSTTHAFDMSTGVNVGLWRVKASSSGTFEHSSSSADANSVTISAKIAKVNIMRPWFSESLFRLKNWSNNMLDKGVMVSNGKIDSTNAENLIPMYPVAFVVARDITIKADFSHEEMDHISRSVKAGASVGYGPFSISGSYSNSKTEDKFTSDFQNGEIKVPGMQIIGWVSRLIPESPKK